MSDLPPEAFDAEDKGELSNTGTDNGLEDDVFDDQAQTVDPVPGSPA